MREQATSLIRENPDDEFGGIVPHAGWVCSGAIAARTLAAIASRTPRPDVVVIFASIHTPIPTARAVVDEYDAWMIVETEFEVHDVLRRELLKSEKFVADNRFHASDHAVEVQLPLIATLWSRVPFVAIETPTQSGAPAMGVELANAIRRLDLNAVVLASSDLTHYGPGYGFTPAGSGRDAELWARDNDRRLLEAVVAFQPDRVVHEASERWSACGGGAIGAMLSCCQSLGATVAKVLVQTNSNQTLRTADAGASDNFVGYASVVVGIEQA